MAPGITPGTLGMFGCEMLGDWENADSAAGRKSGSAVKKSLAMRARTAGSGKPAGTSAASGAEPGRNFSGSLAVVMVVTDFDLVERSDGVVDEDRCGAIERNQIGGEGTIVDAHETHREAGSLFTGQAGLEETDDALFLFADTEKKDAGLAAGRFG